jgi:epoxide hydrolase 4
MGLAESMGFKSHYLPVNGVRLHVVEKGSGPVVLLLHGWPEFWYSWRHSLEYLSDNYRVVAPDLRGFNLSEKPSGIESYSLGVLVEDILSLIDALGGEQVHLVGHDWGGVIAWQFAIQYPDRIRDLVIMNCPHPEAFRQALKKDWSQRRKSWYMLFFQIPALPEFLLRATLPQVFERVFRGWSYNKEAFTDEDLARYVEAFRQPGALRSSINYYRAIFRLGPPRTDRFRTPIPVPILVLWGKGDRALGHSLTKGMERFAGAGYTQIDFDRCSHWIQNEYPERIHEAMRAFWAGS